MEVVPLILLLLIPLSVHAGFFQKLTNLFQPEMVVADSKDTFGSDALSVPLLNSNQNPNPAGTGGGDILYSEGVLLSNRPVGAEAVASSRQNNTGEISVYVVREGDTLSQIAEMYGVNANTILWANDLTNANGIQPGQTLVILPVAGVQHTVKTGETLASIVKKYDADMDEVLDYNNLTEGAELTAGDEIIIPGGTIKTVTPVQSSGGVSAGPGGGWLAHPMPGAQRSQGIHGYNAVDFARMPTGTTIRAAAAGTVIVARSGGWNGGYGNYVVIKHDNGVQTLYAHLNSVEVSSGQAVSQGERLGGVGTTGQSTGVHLHFEVRGGTNPF